MYPLELNYSTRVGPEYANIDEAQEKDQEKTFMSVIEIFKEKMNNINIFIDRAWQRYKKVKKPHFSLYSIGT